MMADAGGLLLVGAVALSIVTAATPLLLAALGELVAERAGVLNLGVEGTMLVGAVAAFAAAETTGSGALGVLAGAAAGTAMAGLFAGLTLGLGSNQVASGLALTIFGSGLSALAGAPLAGRALPPLPRLLGQDGLVWFSLAAVGAVWWFLWRTRAGLVLRAVGEADASAHALGHPVRPIRAAAVLFGGAMAGLAGAELSLSYTPMWVEDMVAGRGWIALALVVFASWRPGRLLVGAYLFGAIGIMQLWAQGSGLVAVPTQFLAMLPYAATVVVLAALSRRGGAGAPGCLGRTFRPAG